MATRSPVLLIHGMAIKTTMLRRAFGRIDSVLAAEGHTVFVSRIYGFGSVENNTAQLAAEVERKRRSAYAYPRIYIQKRREKR